MRPIDYWRGGESVIDLTTRQAQQEYAQALADQQQRGGDLVEFRAPADPAGRRRPRWFETEPPGVLRIVRKSPRKSRPYIDIID